MSTQSRWHPTPGRVWLERRRNPLALKCVHRKPVLAPGVPTATGQRPDVYDKVEVCSQRCYSLSQHRKRLSSCWLTWLSPPETTPQHVPGFLAKGNVNGEKLESRLQMLPWARMLERPRRCPLGLCSTHSVCDTTLEFEKIKDKNLLWIY